MRVSDPAGPTKTACGRLLRILAAAPDRDAGFLAEIRAGACRHFTTVLRPGQPWHDDHLHLDLGTHGRSGTYRICQ